MGALTITYFALCSKDKLYVEMLNDRTQGQDQIPQLAIDIINLLGTSPANWADMLGKSNGAWVYTPVWIPQLVMSVGTILLAVCLWDHLIRLLSLSQAR